MGAILNGQSHVKEDIIMNDNHDSNSIIELNEEEVRKQ